MWTEQVKRVSFSQLSTSPAFRTPEQRALTHTHTRQQCVHRLEFNRRKNEKQKLKNLKPFLLFLHVTLVLVLQMAKHITNIAWHIGRRFCVLRFANATLHAAHGAQCTMFNLLKWNTTCELLEWPPKRSKCKKKTGMLNEAKFRRSFFC